MLEEMFAVAGKMSKVKSVAAIIKRSGKVNGLPLLCH